MDPKEAAKHLAEELSRKVEENAQVERAVREAGRAAIGDVLSFVAELDRHMKSRKIGSIEVAYHVDMVERMLEVGLKVSSAGHETVLRFAAQKAKIFVAAPGDSKRIQSTGPVYTQKQIIGWISKQIMA